MTVSGSLQWQHDVFAVATLILLYEVWRGWQLGFVRGVLRLAALICAWIGGSMAAGATGSFLAFFSKVPPFLAPVIAALTVGLTIYLGISILSGLLFKRTDHHEGLVRIGFGLGGALCGVIYGLLLLLGGFSLIRGLGALGEMRVAQAEKVGKSLTTEQQALFVIKLKKSLELGEWGTTIRQIDPLTAFYDGIVKFSQIVGNQQSTQRLFQYPAVLEIIKNPKVMAFLQDPALQKAAETKNALPLLQNKHLQEIIQDQQIVTQLKNLNFTGAFDFALKPSPPEVRVEPGKLRQRISPPSPSTPQQATNAPSPISTAR